MQLRYVDEAYRHHPKVATSLGVSEGGGARLKWYSLAKAETPVPEPILSLARAHIDSVLCGPTAPHTGELGFVTLHRCGSEFYFLILCTWRGSNEIWETVFAKENDTTQGFSHFPRDARHKPTFCVWEMAIVWHETQAWARFLNSSRGADDQDAYLASGVNGIV